MAMLQCDICGGKLKGKPGGIYECEFCGVEYDTAWAKAKIQEIRGTVQVEGTVQVAGTVKVEGGVSVESLLKRGTFALEDGNWNKADEYYDKVLDIEPENVRAYLGKLMAELHVRNEAQLANQEIPYDRSNNYRKVLQFADGVLRGTLEGYTADIKKRLILRAEARTNAQAKQKEADQVRLLPIREKIRPLQGLISVHNGNCIAVKADGTAITTSLYEVTDWRDIVAVSAGDGHYVGLKSDGKVVATGNDGDGRCHVSDWKGITAISAGRWHTVGLKTDGTVMATGYKNNGQCKVSDWSNIVAISAGGVHTVGLKADGTVVATGENKDGQCNVSDWTEMVAISAGEKCTVGLKSDGTVVIADQYGFHNEKVRQWRDIVAISAEGDGIIGLKSDGKVVAVGFPTRYSLDNWTEIVAITGGKRFVAGLKANGSVRVGDCGREEKLNVGNWRLFNNFEKLEQERSSIRQKRQEKERIARQKQEQKLQEERLAVQRREAGLCQHCGGELKGFFNKKCVACGKPKDY